jgi:hypothetical protein
VGSRAQKQDKFALWRLLLNEKVQLVEMHQLGIFTKEELLSHLEQIEARYKEVATRPTLAERCDGELSAGSQRLVPTQESSARRSLGSRTNRNKWRNNSIDERINYVHPRLI